MIRTIQNQRKEIGCEYTDRIAVGIVSDDPEVHTTLESHRDLICGETLTERLLHVAIDHVGAVDTEYGKVFVQKAKR